MKIKPYQLLYMAMMAVGMGQTVIFAVMPMLGRELGLHELVLRLPWLGWEYHPKELAITSLSAITALTFSMASPFWGRLSDKLGRKPVIVTGLLGYTLGMALFTGSAWLGLQGVVGGLGLYALLVLTRIIHSSVMSAAMPASNAYIVDITHTSQRSHGLGQLSAFMQIGVMCGPALAYLMVYSYLTPFVFQSTLMLVMGLLILWRFPYHKPEIHEIAKPKLRFTDKRFAVYLALVLVVYSGIGMVQQTLGFYFQDVLHLTGIQASKQYALAMVCSSAAMLFSQLYLVPRIKTTPHQLIRIGLPFIVMGFVGLSLASAMWMLAGGMALFGLGMGLSGPSFSAAASLTVDKQEQGALAGLVGSLSGMGFVIGPLLGGFIYSVAGGFTYDVAAMAIGLALVYVMLKKLPAET